MITPPSRVVNATSSVPYYRTLCEGTPAFAHHHLRVTVSRLVVSNAAYTTHLVNRLLMEAYFC
jgi:hypothetical protein